MTAPVQTLPMKWKPTPSVSLRAALAIFFCLYYVLYFATFNEGEPQINLYLIHGLKFIALCLLFYGFSPYLPQRKTPRLLWAYVAFGGLCFLNYVAASFMYGGYGAALFFNQLIFLPFGILIFKSEMDEPVVKTMDTILCILLLQIPLCALLTVFQHPLWPNATFFDGAGKLYPAFVGGMSNPNSFGVALVLCLIYVNSLRAADRWSVPFSTLLILGALMTQSLLVACLLPVVPIVLFYFDRDSRRFIIREGHYAVLLKLASAANFTPHLDIKILALLQKFGLAHDAVQAGSIEGRLTQTQHVMSALVFQNMHAFLRAVFWGHSDGAVYMPVDSQYFCLLLNFGIALAAMFLALNGLLLMRALRAAPKYRAFLFTSLVVFNIAFVANRLLDYFPMGLLYVLLLAATFRQDSRPASSGRKW
jgi:hypothetical protein